MRAIHVLPFYGYSYDHFRAFRGLLLFKTWCDGYRSHIPSQRLYAPDRQSPPSDFFRVRLLLKIPIPLASFAFPRRVSAGYLKTICFRRTNRALYVFLTPGVHRRPFCPGPKTREVRSLCARTTFPTNLVMVFSFLLDSSEVLTPPFQALV